jgi:hypothetical protein
VRGKQKLRLLAACLVLGRLVSVRLPQHRSAPARPIRAANPEKADWRKQPKPNKTFYGRTSSALITGLIICLVTVVLSGVVSFSVADRTSRGQSQDTARQAVSSQQLQELLQMQESADAADEDAQNVAVYAFKCSAKGKKWAACIFDAPDHVKLLADSDALGTIVDSTTGQQADSLALKLADEVNALITSSTVLAGIKDLGSIANTKLDLDQHCGQLIQGYA